MRFPRWACLTALVGFLSAVAVEAASAELPATPIPALSSGVSAANAVVIVRFDRRTTTLVDARGYADPFTRRVLTADDPARIASVSKLVVALGVMRLVDAGKIDLRRDVSHYLGWRLRHPRFPERPISLELLLSHRSGLIDRIDYAIPLGGSVRDALGAAEAWDEAHQPGRYFRYANLNFPVIATVLEAATGERFDRLMARLVMTPLGLDACFNWTSCSDGAVARAVVLTDEQGSVRRDRLDAIRPACPVVTVTAGACDLDRYIAGTNGAIFSPQGGLRISANDLARIGRMLVRRGQGFLTRSAFDRLVNPIWRFDGQNGDSENGLWCRYALAVQTLATASEGCRDDPFADGRPRVGHPGEAYGLRSGLWVDLKRGTGIAYFITAVADDAARGTSAFTRAEEALLTRAQTDSATTP